jgi:gluconate 2-dehydrogenase gamma chain
MSNPVHLPADVGQTPSSARDPLVAPLAHMETRRENLKIIAAIGATCAFPFSADELYAQEHVHPAPAPITPAGPFTPKFFTAEEIQLITRLSDLIIPATDTPGASGAGVPKYIDYVVSGSPSMQHLLRAGLPMLGADFLSKTEAEQIAILKPLSDEVDADRVPKGSPAELFHTLKNLTCDGYYTSQIGLVQELGYQGSTVLASFPGCSHEDHIHEH